MLAFLKRIEVVLFVLLSTVLSLSSCVSLPPTTSDDGNETTVDVSEVQALLDYAQGLIIYRDDSTGACLVERLTPDKDDDLTLLISLAGGTAKDLEDSKEDERDALHLSDFVVQFCRDLPILRVEAFNSDKPLLARRKRQSGNGYYATPNAQEGRGRAHNHWNSQPGQLSQAQVQGQVFGRGIFSGQAQSQNGGMSQSQVQLAGVGIHGQLSSSSGNAQAQLSLGSGAGSGQASGLGQGPSASQVQVNLGQGEQESMASASASSGGAEAGAGNLWGGAGGVAPGGTSTFHRQPGSYGGGGGVSPGFVPGTRLQESVSPGVSQVPFGSHKLPQGQQGYYPQQQSPGHFQGVGGSGVGGGLQTGTLGLEHGPQLGHHGSRGAGGLNGPGSDSGIGGGYHGAGGIGGVPAGHGISSGTSYGTTGYPASGQVGDRRNGISSGHSPGLQGISGGGLSSISGGRDTPGVGAGFPGTYGTPGISSSNGYTPTEEVTGGGHGLTGQGFGQGAAGTPGIAGATGFGSGLHPGGGIQHGTGTPGTNGRYGLHAADSGSLGQGSYGRPYTQSSTPGAYAATTGQGQAQAQTVYFGSLGNGQYYPLRYGQASQPGGNGGGTKFQDQHVGAGIAGQRQQSGGSNGNGGSRTNGGIYPTTSTTTLSGHGQQRRNGYHYTNGYSTTTTNGVGSPGISQQVPGAHVGDTTGGRGSPGVYQPSGGSQGSDLDTTQSLGPGGLGFDGAGRGGDGGGVDSSRSGLSPGQSHVSEQLPRGPTYGRNGYHPSTQNGHRSTTTGNGNGRNGHSYRTNGYTQQLRPGAGGAVSPPTGGNGRTHRYDHVVPGDSTSGLTAGGGQTSSGQDGFSPSYGLSRPSPDDPDGKKCTIITFSCTIVIDSNGRAKICRPNAVKMNGNRGSNGHSNGGSVGGGGTGSTGGGGSQICCC